MTKKQFKNKAKAFIQHKINTDLNWTLKGLTTVFANQTIEEQRVEVTRNHNRRGFTPADAKILCNIAKKVGRFNLSEKQIFVVRKRLPKYWKQIYNVCDKIKLADQMFNQLQAA